MTTELDALSQIPGVVGVCFQHGSKVVYHTLPPAYGQATADSLADAVHNALAAYQDAGRRAKQLYLQFPEAAVLVLSSPLRDDQSVSVLVHSQTAVARVLGPCLAFLARQ